MLTFTFRLSDNNNNHTRSCADIGDTVNRAANDPSVLKITEKAPTRPFSWLKVPTIAFTFKDTTLNGYVDVKLGCQCNERSIA